MVPLSPSNRRFPVPAAIGWTSRRSSSSKPSASRNRTRVALAPTVMFRARLLLELGELGGDVAADNPVGDYSLGELAETVDAACRRARRRGHPGRRREPGLTSLTRPGFRTLTAGPDRPSQAWTPRSGLRSQHLCPAETRTALKLALLRSPSRRRAEPVQERRGGSCTSTASGLPSHARSTVLSRWSATTWRHLPTAT